MTKTINGLGEQISIKKPKVDFSLGTITNKIMIKACKKTDKVIYEKIIEIAKERDVNTLIVLDKDQIKGALMKASPRKVKRVSCLLPFIPCPSCGEELKYDTKYCGECGQKLNWKGYRK